jgi:hypothetical protein
MSEVTRGGGRAVTQIQDPNHREGTEEGAGEEPIGNQVAVNHKPQTLSTKV